jgi:uncharacterized metal-binding protein YceD (DUF177 family)
MSKSTEKAPPRPWSLPLTVHEVPATGRRFELTADAQARAAVAKLAGVRDISRLEAVFEVGPYKQGGLRVQGDVSATVGQMCVVTLDPIENEIQEVVDLVLLPEAPAPAANATEVEVGDDDPPEPLVGGTIDLGAIATEFVVLAIDPHPRKPGAVFEAPAAGDAAAKPFAALAALKKNTPENEG